MEQTHAAVSMPAHPGATVLVTGVNHGETNAPAAAKPIDKTGLSESQTSSAHWLDKNGPEIAKGSSNPFLLRAYREHVQHVFGDGPAPAGVPQSPESSEAALEQQGVQVVQGGDMPELAAAFVPIAEQDTGPLINRAVIVGNVPRETAAEAAQFCLDAQLPRGVSEGIMDRIGKHASYGYGPGTEALTPDDVATLSTECARALGGEDKAAAEVTLARKYLHSVGGDKLLDYVDQKAGSLAFDPRLVLQLSMLARAKGLDK